jgi:hypothetical protein
MLIEAAPREATRQAARTTATEAAGTAAGQAPSAQFSRRDRAGRTRMATVTAVYDAPATRTAADVLPTDRTEREARRPGPTATSHGERRRVWLGDQTPSRTSLSWFSPTRA